MPYIVEVIAGKRAVLRVRAISEPDAIAKAEELTRKYGAPEGRSVVIRDAAEELATWRRSSTGVWINRRH